MLKIIYTKVCYSIIKVKPYICRVFDINLEHKRSKNRLKSTKKGILYPRNSFRWDSLSSKREKEKADCCPFLFHTACIADSAVAWIFYWTIVFHITDCRVTGVFNCAVRFYIADSWVAGVFDVAIWFNVADSGVAGILNRSVWFNITGSGVAGILNRSVWFNIADWTVAAAFNSLCIPLP